MGALFAYLEKNQKARGLFFLTIFFVAGQRKWSPSKEETYTI
jgi:hypothetical protein